MGGNLENSYVSAIEIYFYLHVSRLSYTNKCIVQFLRVKNVLCSKAEDYLLFLFMVLGFTLGLLPRLSPRFFFPRPLVFSFAFAARKSFFILGSTTLYRPFTPGGRTDRFCAVCFFATTYVTSFFGS